MRIVILQFLVLGLALPSFAQNLIVSEIMYHPLPLSASDEDELGEYLELHNVGETPIDLSGYRFDRGIGFDFPNYILPSKAYLVIAKNPQALLSAFPIEHILGGYSGSLSNSGEGIRLRDSFGKTHLSFRYGTTGQWPAAPDGTGHSLVFKIFRENQNDLNDPNDPENWRASHFREGNPGKADAAFSFLEKITLIEKGSFARYFKGIREPSNGTTDWTLPDFDDADWLVGESGFGYSSNDAELAPISTILSDMRGNYLSLFVRIAFELEQKEIERFGQLILTMHYDDAYVVYLNGTRIASAGVNGMPPTFDQVSIDGDDYFPHTLDLSEHRALLLSGDNWLAIQGHNVGLDSSSDFVLAAELDLQLTPEPIIEDHVSQIIINEIQSNHGTEPDFVEFFNPTERAMMLDGMWISDKSDRLDLYQFPAQTRIAPGAFWVQELSAEHTGFAFSANGDRIFLSNEDLSRVLASYAFGAQMADTSIGRFPDGTAQWFRSNRPSPNSSNHRNEPKVFITEIMYHDAQSDRLEYIEIRNRSENAVDVSGWEFDGIRFRFSEETELIPDQNYLIAADGDALGMRYEMDSHSILGDFSGNLRNGGERITLFDQNGIVIDTVDYEDRLPWPLTPDGFGASLERRCFESGFDLPTAWAASPIGLPSPGRTNFVENCESSSSFSSVKISEFLYHPSTRIEDDRLGEFIELFNSGESAVDLGGWMLVGDVTFAFPVGTRIASGEVFVIAKNRETLIASSIDPDDIIGNFIGELPNGGGQILLVQSDGQLVDHIEYDDFFPWPSLADGAAGEDISLSRLCFETEGTSAINWEATPSSPGIVTKMECALPSSVIATGTIPEIVNDKIEPIVFAKFAGEVPERVLLEYWIDDLQIEEGEMLMNIPLNDTGIEGDALAGDGIWSVKMPALAANSIVRYRFDFEFSNGSGQSPHADRDAFSWHAYFVDPQRDSHLSNNYHLFISSSDWRFLHNSTEPGRVNAGRANPNWNNEVPAVFVAGGVVHDVSVRHQGSRWNRRNGSTVSFDCASHRSRSAQVRSWRIDFPSFRNHEGIDILILQKQSGWPQHISFRMFELAGVPAPRTSWANLRINGCDYNSDAFQIERPGRDLVARWFWQIGDLFKSQGFTGNEGPWSWGDERLIRGSQNGFSEQERYEHTYNRKTLRWKNHPFDGVEDDPERMIEGLNAARRQGHSALRAWLAAHFDIDRTLRYLCTINYVGTFDDMFQNHYLYKKADDGKWCMFPWDMDNTLGGAFGEARANPFRGVNERRHGNVGNRNGWWNRIKDSFFIAFESEFLEMFYELNNSVHSPESLASIIKEGAQIRGLGQSRIDSLLRHIERRHDYLNAFIEPRLAPPRLRLTQNDRGIVLSWNAHRNDFQLESTSNLSGDWMPVMTNENRFEIEIESAEMPSRFFRLHRRP